MYSKRRKPYNKKKSYLSRSEATKKRKRLSYNRGQLEGANTNLAPVRTGGFYGPEMRSIVEKKVIDTGFFTADPQVYSFGTMNFDNAGSVITLNLCQTGTDFTERIGRKIMMKSLYLRGIIQKNPHVDTQLCRIIIVYDKQFNSQTNPPALNQILLTNDGAITTTFSWDQFNLNNRDRFVILYDKTIATGPSGFYNSSDIAGCSSPTAWNGYIQIKKYKKLNLETIYAGTTDANGSIQSGALFMYTIGDNNNGGTGTDYFKGTCRIRFVDA